MRQILQGSKLFIGNGSVYFFNNFFYRFSDRDRDSSMVLRISLKAFLDALNCPEKLQQNGNCYGSETWKDPNDTTINVYANSSPSDGLIWKPINTTREKL
jgi:hypothetical protein